MTASPFLTLSEDEARALARCVLGLEEAGRAVEEVVKAVPAADHPAIKHLSPVRGRCGFAAAILRQVISPALIAEAETAREAERAAIEALAAGRV